MTQDYNKLEYFKLLEKKSIGEKLNSNESSKLSFYSLEATKYLNWCIQGVYLDLLEKFRKKKIKIFDFCTSFRDIDNLIYDIVAILESNFILIEPNEKSLAFSDLLDKVIEASEDYLQDLEFGERPASVKDYEVRLKQQKIALKDSEVYLNDLVENTYFKIQNFLKEE